MDKIDLVSILEFSKEFGLFLRFKNYEYEDFHHGLVDVDEYAFDVIDEKHPDEIHKMEIVVKKGNRNDIKAYIDGKIFAIVDGKEWKRVVKE